MLFRNTLAQSAGTLTGYLFSFLLAPLMLTKLGLAEFGLWAITGAVATYAGLADLGITRSLSRFIAIYDAHDDQRAIGECVGLGIIAITALTLVSGAAAVVLAPLFVDEFGLLGTADMRLVLLSSVGIFSWQAYGRVLNAVPIGRREMVPPNVANVIGNVVNFAFSVTALLVSPQLTHYALANLAAELLGLVVILVALRRVRRPLAVALPSRRRTSEVVRFGLKEQLSWLADLVNFQTDKFIIALTVDIRAAAAYEIAVRVVLGVRSVAVLTVSAMIPTAAADIEERGSEVIHEFYERYLKRTVALGFPIFLASCVSAPFLMVVWLGESPAYAQGVLIVLALGYAVNITTGVGSTVTIAAGNPGVVARNASLVAILNVALTLALAPTFGVAGVLAGTFLAVSIGSLLFVRSFHRLYGVPYAIYVSAVSGPAALAAAVALPPTALQFFGGAGEDRLEALILLVGSAGGYLAVYWIIASRLDWLPNRLRFRGLRRRTAGCSSGPEQERAGAP